MASTQAQTHAEARAARQANSLLRPARDAGLDLAATYDAQRVLGNHALGGLTAPAAPLPPTAPAAIAQRARLVVQPKLTLGPVDDAFEREADTMAQQVVQRIAAPPVQRHADEDEVQRAEDEALEEEEEEPVQAKRTGSAPGPTPLDAGVESEIQRARAGGSALDPGVRTSMEGAFGSDFSGVRVHADSQADSLNRQVRARAFTTGRDIFFRAGEYSPDTTQGQQLLAHELTHVVQQGGATVRAKRAAQELFFGATFA